MRKKPLVCSFCGKDSTQVAKLLAGPGVFICDECVGICNEILIEEVGDHPGTERIVRNSSAPAAPQLPGWDTMAAEDLLASLPRLAAAQQQVELSLKGGVARLREQGVTWQRIGEAFGMTRQSAWERFSGEE